MTRFVLALAFLLVLGLTAPPANAALAEGFVPVVERGEGLEIVRVKGAYQARFAPRAARLYRRIAGRTVAFGCSRVERSGPGGLIRTESVDVRTVRAPRRRSRLTADLAMDRPDFCSLAIRTARLECEDDGWCPVAIQAFTEAGRARVDELARTADVSFLLLGVMLATKGDRWPTLPALDGELDVDDGDVVALAGPDDTPARHGAVGYWSDGTALVIAARTRDGRRLFVRLDGDTMTTNLPDWVGGD